MSGGFELETCPLDAVDEPTVRLIELARLFKRGLPPVAGGTLDQAAGFLAAAAFVWDEDEHYEREAAARLGPWAMLAMMTRG